MGFPTTVSVMETGLGAAKVLVAIWFAVIVAIPGFKSVAVAPTIEATDGSDEVKLQAPGEFEFGG